MSNETPKNVIDLERFFTLSGDLLCVANFDGFFVKINPAWEKTLGYTSADLQGKPFLEFVHPDDVQPTIDVMSQMGVGTQVLSFVNRYRRKDGDYCYFEWHATPADGLIYATARDISEQKAAEEALRRDRERMRAIIDSQTNYMLRTDLEGNYTYANQKYITDYGWIHGGPDAIMGSNCLPAISAHHQAAVAETVRKCIGKPGTVFQVEMDKPLQDGTLANTIWDFICLTDAQGQPTEMQCLGINITERKRLEIEQSERQTVAMLEMSTPITQLWDGILLLPLVGIVNAKRAQSVMMLVLQKIVDTQAKVLILDISGVAMVDTEVANHFVKLAKATKLMGCACTISGISPAVAQTIVELGFETQEMSTIGNMRDALQDALLKTGAKVVHL